LLGNDHVGVDIVDLKRGGDASEGRELVHDAGVPSMADSWRPWVAALSNVAVARKSGGATRT
jgi:hypothetical protein